MAKTKLLVTFKNVKERWIIKRPVHYTEIVQDVSILRDSDGPDLWSACELLFPPRRRSLYPRNIAVKLPEKQSLQSCRLLVVIIGAKNVPVRSFRDRDSHHADNSLRRYSSVRSFGNLDNTVLETDSPTHEEECTNSVVQVRFQDKTTLTRSVPGPSPMWKQNFSFPIQYDDTNFSPQSFLRLKDCIEITLFDIFDVDARPVGGFYDDEHAIIKEKRYLGHLSVPFSTIYINGKTKGSIRLDSPSLTLGYSKNKAWMGDIVGDDDNLGTVDVVDSDVQSDSSSRYDMDAVGKRSCLSNPKLTQEAASGTYINVLLTLDPLLCPPDRVPHTPLSEETDTLSKYAHGWSQSYFQANPTCRKKGLQLMVSDSSSRGWIIIRFLRSQPPPKGLDSICKCAHFVSLIPYLDDGYANSSNIDIWRTSQEFLASSVGGIKEHAALLANYFMHLSCSSSEECRAEVYLVFGMAIPEGETVSKIAPIISIACFPLPVDSNHRSFRFCRYL